MAPVLTTRVETSAPVAMPAVVEEFDVDVEDEPIMPPVQRRRGRPPGRSVAHALDGDHGASLRAAIAETRKRQVLELLADGQVHVAGAIARTVGVGAAVLVQTTQALVRAGQIVMCGVPEGKKGFSAYRLATELERARRPPVRTIAVPEFDAIALRQKVASVLRSGATYDLAEVVRSCSVTLPYATKETVQPQLDGLIKAGKARRIPIGSFTRYQVVEDGAQRA